MIFTILYNNFKVINRSLTKLRATNVLNLPIVALDNHYPFLTKAQKTILKKKFNLTIIDCGENLGLSAGYNKLIELHPQLEYAILYDCDSNPETKGWDKELMSVVQKPDMAYVCLMFEIAKGEMIKRGFTPIQVDENVVWKPHAACVQSISCADLSYLRSIGGLQEPKKYYGGLESFMFKYWNDQHKLVYIDGVSEVRINGKDLSDKIYNEYKWAYAHQGYNGKFEDFINENTNNKSKSIQV